MPFDTPGQSPMQLARELNAQLRGSHRNRIAVGAPRNAGPFTVTVIELDEATMRRVVAAIAAAIEPPAKESDRA